MMPEAGASSEDSAPAQAVGDRAHLILGAAAVIAALSIAFVWVPFDVESGLIEKVRRRVSIGDALAPTVAAAFIGLGGLLLLLAERKTPNQPALTFRNLVYLGIVLVLIAVSFGLMRWSGPVAIAAFSDIEAYRLARDTAPWKHIGFLLGGASMIAGLIGLVEGRLTLRGVAIAVLAAFAMILLYDLPFDDLLLPPNGDV